MSLIYVLNGPNLNMLGTREPEIYGHDTIKDAERLARAALPQGWELRFEQTNYEGQLIDWIHEAVGTAHAIVINPAALTHTSIAVLDALMNFTGEVIEVHISQIHKREEFRHHSYVSQRADVIIVGMGIQGYAAAVHHATRA